MLSFTITREEPPSITGVRLFLLFADVQATVRGLPVPVRPLQDAADVDIAVRVLIANLVDQDGPRGHLSNSA